MTSGTPTWTCSCKQMFFTEAEFQAHWMKCTTDSGVPVVPAREPGMKFDSGKLRHDLVPGHALRHVVRVLTYGASKYAPENWRKVEGWKWRYFRAALGHLWDWWLGEERDPESGEHHLAHCCCCVLFLLEKEVEPK